MAGRFLPLLFMYYVYLLELNRPKDRYYIGYSSDLKRRISEHQRGLVDSTKHYLPVKLFYYEAYANENLARTRELSLKKKRFILYGFNEEIRTKIEWSPTPPLARGGAIPTTPAKSS